MSETPTPSPAPRPPRNRRAEPAAPPAAELTPAGEAQPTPPRQPRVRRPFSVAQLAAERRRAGISFTVGLIVLLLIQIPAIEQSFLGAPDRQLMETAYRL